MSTSRRAPEATAEPAEQARPGVLAGPSSARLPFVPPPALRSAAGVHAALSLWAGTCFDLALHGLAVDLSEAAESVGHREDEPGSRLRHAAYLLHVDRFADALAALPPPSGGLPAAPSDVTFADLLRATAEAALGDDQALGWLTTMSSALMHSDAADLFAACLARVGDARGDQHLGDAAHRQLGLLGVVNRAVTPRVAALRVLDRDQDEWTPPNNPGRRRRPAARLQPVLRHRSPARPGLRRGARQPRRPRRRRAAAPVGEPA